MSDLYIVKGLRTQDNPGTKLEPEKDIFVSGRRVFVKEFKLGEEEVGDKEGHRAYIEIDRGNGYKSLALGSRENTISAVSIGDDHYYMYHERVRKEKG